MGYLEDVFTAAFRGEGLPHLSWIEWKHISTGMIHCPVCLSLDECWFVEDKKPKLPQHDYCHCAAQPIETPIAGVTAHAECSIDKFVNYIFSDKYAWNGKRRLFEDLGFSINDSERLKEVFEKEAVEKYVRGDYSLRKLDRNGQRIDIEVSVNREGKRPATFISGWMVRKTGTITNNTPLGG